MTTEFDLSRKINRYDSMTAVAGTDIVAVYDASAQTMKKVTVDDLMDASGVEFKLGDDERIYFGDNELATIRENAGDLVIKNDNPTGGITSFLGDSLGVSDWVLANSDGVALLQIDSVGYSEFISKRAGRVGTVDVKNYARQASDVVSITRDGTTATVTTATAHYLATGESITMAGATQTEYNITANVTVTGANTFTYTVSGSPATPATVVADISYTDNTASASAMVIHDYTDATYSFAIDKVGSGTIMRLKLANNDSSRPDKPAGYIGTANYLSLNDGSATWFTLFNGKEWAQLSGIYNMANYKADDGNPGFRFNTYNSHAIHTSFRGGISDDLFRMGTADVSIGTVSSITSSGTTCTVTTAANHELVTGCYITISGANETDYNGNFFITVTAPTTFTYTALATPSATPATGTLVATAKQSLFETGFRYGEGMEIQTGCGDIKLDPYGTIDIDLTANAVTAETLSEFLNIKVGGVAKKLALVA